MISNFIDFSEFYWDNQNDHLMIHSLKFLFLTPFFTHIVELEIFNFLNGDSVAI